MTVDSRLDELLDRWEDAFARGEALLPEELCAECPDLLEDLKRQITGLQAMNHRLRTGTGGGAFENTYVPPPAGDGDLATDEPLAVRSEFERLQFHARGGLGAVYLAADRQLHREVALKFIHQRQAGDRLSRERFLLEAEITGRLEHPGIVPVHGMGQTPDGRLFYAMRFIRGETLEVAIQRYYGAEAAGGPAGERSLEFRSLLGCFVAVCNTVAYAHNRGILHRDLKPENIMLGRYGETLVLDWGLALPVNRDERARHSGEATLVPSSGSGSGDSGGGGAGTPAYMSPEQAVGDLDLGPATDVYSLGATLYKLLTGQPAVTGTNPLEVLQKVRQGRFPPPREIRNEVPPALEAVCLKAMSLDQADRYGTPLELAADVENWLADEPVSAWREPARHRWARWARRHRTLAGSLLLGLVALIVVLGLAALWQNRVADSERELRLTAEQAREQGLRVSALFAAKTVAYEMDLRWRMLEAEAADSELRSLLTRASQPEADRSAHAGLQAWLDARYIEYNDTTRATSWFVTDRRGLQLARTPMAEVIGERFDFRDYFHGLGRDLEPHEVPAEIEPIRQPHRSVAFQSRASGELMVAFSVPVWSGKPGTPDRRVLGVLAMTVRAGEFRVLQLGLGSDRTAVLVDTKQDWLDGTAGRGLVLHHSRLADGAQGEAGRTGRVDAASVERFERLRSLRLKQEHERSGDREPDNLESAWRDPADDADAVPWRAAFEPVLVRGRPDHIRDTGWIVIVQERSPSIPE